MRSILFSAILCLAADVRASKSTDCTFKLSDQFFRGPISPITGTYPISKERLSLFFKSSITLQLTLLHLTGYRLDREKLSYIHYGNFRPHWIFKNKGALDLLCAAFARSDTQQQLATAPATFKTIDDFLDQWEREWEAAGGLISPTWRQERKAMSRREFVKKLLLEMAFRQHENASAPGEIVLLTRSDENDPFTWLPGLTSTITLFQDPQAFEHAFIRFALGKKGVRVYRSDRHGRRALLHVRDQMVKGGVPPSHIESGHPDISADLKRREKERYLREGNHAILKAGKSGFPLVALLREVSNSATGENRMDEAHAVELSLAEARSIANSFGSFHLFIVELNQTLPEDRRIACGSGVFTFARELVIQAGVFVCREEGRSPWDLNVNSLSFLAELSHLYPSELKRMIQERYTEQCGPR